MVGLGNVDNTSDANKPVSTAQQNALNGKENAFTKKTAFNKDFGTTAGTVAQGNDSRFSDARTPLAHTHLEAQITDLDKYGKSEVEAKVTLTTGQKIYDLTLAEITGPQGPKGDKGDQGIQGIEGIQGPKGDKGDTGLTGSQGLKGDKGDTGSKGDKGDQGIQGIQGLKGDKGDQGIQGPAGSNATVTKAAVEGVLTGPITSHTHAYEPTFTKNTGFNKAFGTTVGTVAQGNDSRFSDARTPLAHTHGSVTNDGKIGTTPNLIVQTGTGGALTAKAAGTTAQYLRGDGAWATPESGSSFTVSYDPPNVATMVEDEVWLQVQETPDVVLMKLFSVPVTLNNIIAEGNFQYGMNCIRFRNVTGVTNEQFLSVTIDLTGYVLMTVTHQSGQSSSTFYSRIKVGTTQLLNSYSSTSLTTTTYNLTSYTGLQTIYFGVYSTSYAGTNPHYTNFYKIELS